MVLFQRATATLEVLATLLLLQLEGGFASYASGDSAAHSADSQATCFEYGVDYSGYDIHRAHATQSAVACMSQCKSYPGCALWSWNSQTKGCYLKSAGAFTNRTLMEKVVSGPRQCVFGFRCFDHGVDYYGYDVEKIEGRLVTSPEECQRLCLGNPQCAFFSWRSSNYSCFLKSSLAPLGRRDDPDVVSAPRTCSGGQYPYPPHGPPDISDYPTQFDPTYAPPPCAEPNVEYRGYSIRSAKANTAAVCQRQCHQTTDCSFWTWSLDTNICTLKNADALNGKASDGSTLNKVSGARDCIPVIQQCQFAHIGVVAGNISTVNGETYDDCQLHCLRETGCTHWTHNIEKELCTLWSNFTGYSQGKSTQGLVSGPAMCDSEELCFEHADYVGHDIEEIETGNTRSPAACQSLCRNHNECQFWTWLRSNKSCYLKDSNALLGKVNDTTSLGRYSGPKKCSLVFGCVGINSVYTGATLSQLSAPDYRVCSAACKSNSACTGWNYFNDHKLCILKGGSIALVNGSIRGALCGGRDCPAVIDVVEENDCFDQGMRYNLDFLVGYFDTLNSAEECYSKCQITNSCTWFSYSGDICFLLASTTEPDSIFDPTSTSGPSQCLETGDHDPFIHKYTFNDGLLKDVSNFVLTPGACSRRCEKAQKCAFWTYLSGEPEANCLLFDSTAAHTHVRNEAAISGQIQVRPFITRGCTFRDHYSGSSAPSPVDCQQECRGSKDCEYWSWEYQAEGNNVIPTCKYFKTGADQVLVTVNPQHYACGTKFPPGKLQVNMAVDGTEAKKVNGTLSISSCDAACYGEPTCVAWTLNTTTAVCTLFSAANGFVDAKLKISSLVTPVVAPVSFFTVYLPAAVDEFVGQRLSTRFRKKTTRRPRKAKSNTLADCIRACQQDETCTSWSFHQSCTLLSGPVIQKKEVGGIAGAKGAPILDSGDFLFEMAFTPIVRAGQGQPIVDPNDAADPNKVPDTASRGDGSQPQFKPRADDTVTVAYPLDCAALTPPGQCWTFDTLSGNCSIFTDCEDDQLDHAALCVSGRVPPGNQAP